MASAPLLAMILRSLLVSAKDPFKWTYAGSDWFIARDGINQTCEYRNAFFPNPFSEDAKLLESEIKRNTVTNGIP